MFTEYRRRPEATVEDWRDGAKEEAWEGQGEAGSSSSKARTCGRGRRGRGGHVWWRWWRSASRRDLRRALDALSQLTTGWCGCVFCAGRRKRSKNHRRRCGCWCSLGQVWLRWPRWQAEAPLHRLARSSLRARGGCCNGYSIGYCFLFTLYEEMPNMRAIPKYGSTRQPGAPLTRPPLPCS